MKRIIHIFLTTIFAAILFACSTKKETQTANFNVIPLPNEITTNDGAPFIFGAPTQIIYPEGNEKMKQNAEFLADYFATVVSIKPTISLSAEKGQHIVLQLGLENENPEAYRLEVTKDAITITGASEAGVFYGIQTLRKATPLTHSDVSYPSVVINDAPRFGYRGAHLDVGRHYFPADFIKKYIDILALHNLNRFHWHLTEDQGWRIEIKKYPKLTEIGSKRSETVIGRNTGEFDGKPHEGFYSQEEVKEIVQYAQARYITIIPEIDLPGHMLAALAAYPELGCTGGPYEVEKRWGVFDDVLCPGKEETFTFLQDVLTEVMELFPSEYIHIGGDECPKVRWEKCPRCQAKIKELGLKDDDKHKKEFYLQSYVTARIEKFLNDHGRQIIGWDEILEGELAPNATVMSWRGMGGGIEAAKMNHDVIMTPTHFAYFDYYQTTDIENEPLAIGGYLPIEMVYQFEPVPASLTDAQKKHILGAQANVWTEYIPTSDHTEYMLLPRLAAMSEVLWTQSDKKNYTNFLKRLPQLMKMYDKLEYNYAKHVFEIQAKMTPNFETNALDVELSAIDDAPIFYTTDGSEPTKNSTRYEEKFSLNESADLKAIAIRKDGSKSKVWSKSIKTSKSSYKPVELLTQPSPTYAFEGAPLLVDGIFGSGNYKSRESVGFQSDDLVAVIDMLTPTEITKAMVSTTILTGDWIFDAQSIKVEASDDNSTYSLVKEETITDTHHEQWAGANAHTVSFDAPVTARYFKITVAPVRQMPDWHPGKGHNAYVFVDEIALD